MACSYFPKTEGNIVKSEFLLVLDEILENADGLSASDFDRK
jgi:hypothetical protein